MPPVRFFRTSPAAQHLEPTSGPLGSRPGVCVSKSRRHYLDDVIVRRRRAGTPPRALVTPRMMEIYVQEVSALSNSSGASPSRRSTISCWQLGPSRMCFTGPNTSRCCARSLASRCTTGTHVSRGPLWLCTWPPDFAPIFRMCKTAFVPRASHV